MDQLPQSLTAAKEGKGGLSYCMSRQAGNMSTKFLFSLNIKITTKCTLPRSGKSVTFLLVVMILNVNAQIV